MNKTGHLLVLHGLVVGLLSAWHLTDCLSCNFFLEGLLCHPCQEKVSLCTLKSECVNPLFFLRSTRPVEARFTFQSPANVFCFVLFFDCFVFLFRPERVSWRGGGDGGGREEGVDVTEWVRSLWAPRKERGPKDVTSVKIPLLWHFAAFHFSFMVKVTSSIIYIGTYYFLPCITWFTLTSFHPFIQF